MKVHIDAKQNILNGVKLIGKVVGDTMGPKGNCVLLQQSNGSGYLTKDGVTVSKYVESEDKIETMAIGIVREAALKTVRDVGDGTSCTTVLAAALMNNCSEEYLNNDNIPDLIQELHEANDLIQKTLFEMKREATQDDLVKVATISANHDHNLAKLIADAANRVGKDGQVIIEQSNLDETRVIFSSGFEVDSGFANKAFITDTLKQRVILDKPLVWVINKPLLTYLDAQALMPILEYAVKLKRPLLIFAPDIAGDPLATLMQNCRVIPLCAVKTNILEDLAAVVNATVKDPILGDPLKGVSEQDLGTCEQVIITASNTIINGAKVAKTHVEQLKEQLAKEEKVTKKILLEARIARLGAGVATIKIGGLTPTEIRETFDRAEDCILAVRAAQKQGVLPGGGTAFLKARKMISNSLPGYTAVYKALAAPLMQMLSNANLELPLGHEMLITNDTVLGFDIINEELCNVFDVGILDPFLVCSQALNNAISVVCSLLKANIIIENT